MGDSSTLTGIVAGIAFALLLVAVVVALVDLSRRDDLSTGARVLWAAAVVLLVVVGVVLYFLFRPRGATAGERAARQQASDDFVRKHSRPASPDGDGPGT